MKSPDGKVKIFKSKPVIISASVLFAAILILLGIYIVDHVQRFYLEKMQSDEGERFPDAIVVTPKIGKYYLNGDKNSYYFEILPDNKIQLCSDDLYSIFETWNPGNDEVILKQAAEWEEVRDFSIVVTPLATVILAVEVEVDNDGKIIKMSSGPCLLDENTLGKWGNQGDFIYIED